MVVGAGTVVGDGAEVPRSRRDEAPSRRGSPVEPTAAQGVEQREKRDREPWAECGREAESRRGEARGD